MTETNMSATNTGTWRRRIAKTQTKPGPVHGRTVSDNIASSITMLAQCRTVDVTPPLTSICCKAQRSLSSNNHLDEVQATRNIKLSQPVVVSGHKDECIYSCNFAPPRQQAAAVVSAKKNIVLDSEVEQNSIMTTNPTKNLNLDGINAVLLATAGQDGTARIWCIEGPEGQECMREVAVLHGHGNSECLRFCWGDGVTVKLVATTGADGTAALWDPVEEKVVERIVCGERTQVYAGEFLGGESTHFLTAYDNFITLWDIQHGAARVLNWKFLAGKATSTTANVSSNFMDQCFVYDAKLLHTSHITNGPNLITVAMSDGSACLVDMREAAATSNDACPTRPTLRWQAHDRYVCECSGLAGMGSSAIPSFSILTSSGDSTVKLWDIRKLSSNTTHQVSGCHDSAIPPLMVFDGHCGPVYGARFITENREDNVQKQCPHHITSWSADGTVRKWSALDVNSNVDHEILYDNADLSIHCFAFDPSIQFAAAVGSPKVKTSCAGEGADWYLFKQLGEGDACQGEEY